MSKALAFLFSLIALHLFAQTATLEKITIGDGLSQGMVFDILQDKDGFLWVATKDGLNRYDGYHFKVFNHDPFNPHSISGNTVTCLFEDSGGRLWVGTENNGLNLFDKRTERFFTLKNTEGGIPILTTNFITIITETPDSNLWIGTRSGMNRLKWKSGLPEILPTDFNLSAIVHIDHFYFEDKNFKFQPDHYFFAFVTNDGDLLAGTGNGLYQVDPIHATAKWLQTGSEDGPFENVVLAIKQSNDNRIWTSFGNNLLVNENDEWRVVDLPITFQNRIADFAFDESGNLFLTANSSLYVFSEKEQGINLLASYQLDELLEIPASCMELDNSGNVWVGTGGYGVRKFNPDNGRFQHWAKGKSLANITAFADSSTWVFDRWDLLELDIKSGHLTKNPLKNLGVTDVLQGENGDLWISTEFDKGIGKSTIIRKTPNGQTKTFELPFQVRTGKLMEDHNGNIWKSAADGILIRITPSTDELHFFSFKHLITNSFVSYSLMEDANRHIWIGTPYGLVKGVPQGNSLHFSLYKNDPTDLQSLNNNFILSLLDDPNQPDQFLWVGTKGGGLNLLEKATGKFDHITSKDGLPNNVVYGILNDELGYLWMSTNRGLSRYNPKQRTFENFTTANGLQDNEFNTLSYAKGVDGKLFFGGVNGLTVFDPKDFKPDDFVPPVYITGLKVNNLPIDHTDSSGILTKPIEQTNIINLSYSQNLISLEFAALDFSIPTKNKYRYIMEGVDPEWVESGNVNTTSYANLSPGSYTFKVMGSNSDGKWDESPAILQINILPPWWRTKLAYIIYLLTFFTVLWALYRFQVNRAKLRNQLAYEHKEAERLAEIDRLKTNFFSNITHEFRTPLTLIIEPLRQVLPELKDPNVLEKIKLAERNSHHLLGLVNQLLDLSKLEGKKMTLDLRKGNIGEVLRPVFQSFLPLAEKKGITLKFSADKDIPPFHFDQTKVEQVVTNLLSNAVKFTSRGSVQFTVSSQEGQGSGKIIISVTDTGTGIPATEITKIFDRFYQVDGSHTRAGEGTGIGLSLTKELVELMGGEIEVESEMGSGTTFTVSLPPTPSKGGGVKAPSQPPPKGGELPAEATISVDLFDSGKKLNDAPEATPPPLEGVGGRLLLLIEDNADLRQFIRQSLNGEYQVVEASNGAEGIRKALELIPDLIVSDLMMPEKDGFEVTDTLKNDEKTSHIPIILLTAKTAIESKIAGLRRGADAYLTKPFNTEELLVRIEKLLELRRVLQEKFSAGNGLAKSGDPAVFDKIENDFLRRFTLLIEQELDNENLSAEKLSHLMAMSRSQLHRKLTALSGQSTTEFVRNYRLDRAMELLKNKEGNVSEVSMKVGIGNRNYFTKTFKERFGMLPSEVVGSGQ